MRKLYPLLMQSVLKIMDLKNSFLILCDAKNNIKKNLKKGKNGNFIYFLKFPSGWFLTLLETNKCVVYISKYAKFQFCHFHMHILLFSYSVFFVLRDADENFIFYLKRNLIILAAFVQQKYRT